MQADLQKAVIAVVLAVITSTACCSAADPLSTLSEDPSCDDLPSLPPTEDRCAFVKAHCDSEGLIPMLPIYFCYIQPYGKFLSFLAVLLSSALLIVLFRVIGHAADEYFSSILSQISQDMGLPPRLGGVTLLALGNGAPDLSASIAAVRSGNFPLALGALTGSVMFVGCVVAGRIVSLSGGVRSRAAQIRDVLTQFIAILVVTIIVAVGKMTYGAVASLLCLYIFYVIIVAVADFTKRAGVEWTDIGRDFSKQISMKFQRSQLAAPLLQRGSGSLAVDGENGEMLANNNLLDGSSNRGGSQAEVNDGKSANTSNDLDEVESEVPETVLPTVTLVQQPPPALSNLQQSRSGDSSEVELMPSPPISRGRSPLRGARTLPAPKSNNTRATLGDHHSLSAPPGLGEIRRAQTQTPSDTSTSTASNLDYDHLVHMSTKEYRQRALADMAAAVSFYRRGPTAGGSDLEGVLEESDMEDQEGEGLYVRDEERGEYTPPEVDLAAAEESGQRAAGGGAAAAGGAFHAAPRHSGGNRLYDEGETTELPPLRIAFNALWEKLETAAQPAMYLLKATVPIVETSAYDRLWFTIAMAIAPFFICVYLGSLGSFHAVAIAAAAGAASAGLAWICTNSLENEAPVWDFGTGYPIGAGVVAVYGFAVAAMWIDVFASQIVGILHFFGLLAGVHPAVLGVTVLAWGNSLTDFVSNTAMAGKSAGGTSMAMTACFAGPLFNMLVGLGIGFWTYLADTKQTSTQVRFEPVVAVGCAFGMLNCLGVVGVAMNKRHWLPKKFGWLMVGWYFVYLAVVLALVLSGN